MSHHMESPDRATATSTAPTTSKVDLANEHLVTRTVEHNSTFDGHSLAFGNDGNLQTGIHGALPELANGHHSFGNEFQYDRGYGHHEHRHPDVEGLALNDLLESVSRYSQHPGEIMGNLVNDLAHDIGRSPDIRATALNDLIREVTRDPMDAQQVLGDWMNNLMGDLFGGYGHHHGGCHGDGHNQPAQPYAPPEVPTAPPEVPTTPTNNGGDTQPASWPPIVPISWGGDTQPVQPPHAPPETPPSSPEQPPTRPPVQPPEVPPAPPEQPPTQPPQNSGNPADPAGIASRITNDGVSQSDVDLAIKLFNAMPQKMQDAFKQSGAKIVLEPYQGGAQGYNDGKTMVVNTGTGMFAQAFLHEAYEVVGQNTNLAGTWGDANAVQLADQEERAGQVDPGDLNDTVGAMKGDGDWMSNVFVAQMYKRHPELFAGDSPYMLPVATQTASESTQLSSYIDRNLFA